MNLEKEFEIRKAVHLFNTVQLYLTHKYFEEAQQEAVVPPEILQIAIAEQVVNDMQGILCNGSLQETYNKADKYLIKHNIDLDNFINHT